MTRASLVRRWLMLWAVWTLGKTAFGTTIWPDGESVASNLIGGALTGVLWASVMSWWFRRRELAAEDQASVAVDEVDGSEGVGQG